jgi:pyruvate,water dikinase
VNLATSPPLVYSLTTIKAVLPAELGSKALNLVRLANVGLPVPPGFCVCASAYAAHVNSRPLAKSVSAALAGLRASAPGDLRALLAKLRCEIVDAPVSAALIGQMEVAFHELRAARLAVRSSATMEDLAGYSYAGLYDTVLGVSDFAALVSAVKHCWASLWTDRAFDYRERNRFDHRSALMAVVVQRLVEADVSGVLFTADPLSGRNDRLVIEAVFGLGEALVSGKVSPDRTILARHDLRVQEQVVAEKALEIVPGEEGIRERAVELERANTACLSTDIARRLAGLALEAESTLGEPQDVEWAMAGGRIFLLQSRPITTLPKQRSFDDWQVWSNLNAGEVMPDVVTPMTWSFIGRVIEEIFQTLLDPLGLNVRGHPVVGLVAGRAYFNLNTFVGIMRKLPGFRSSDLIEMWGGKPGSCPHVPPEDVPTFDFRWYVFLIRLPALLLWFLAHSTRRGLRCAAVMRRKAESIGSQDATMLSDETLATKLEGLLQETEQSLPDVIAFGGAGAMYQMQLLTLCRKWLGDTDGSFAHRLMSGLGNMESAEAGLAQWRLAALAHAYAGVEQTLLGDGLFCQIRKILPGVAGGGVFLAAWNEFMDRHGHHSRGEVELANARWCETPDVVLNAVRGFLRAQGMVDPISAHRERGHQRALLTSECRRRLGNPLKRIVFDFVLANAQRGCLVRENVKSEGVRRLALARRLILELGERLHRHGLLLGRDDVFFLRHQELKSVVRGQAEFDVLRTIANRKGKHERNLTLRPPSVVVGKFDPERFTAEEFDTNGRALAGIAVSPGVATGPARVILCSDAGEQVLPGEILVAPFTDPGWTPYFLHAVAIVVDQGGLLSHGSIIAREYGIPAVVNVGPATRIIRTGQTLHVDGERGRVTIVDAKESTVGHDDGVVPK